ncbi:hypothetical protein D9M68_927910 [compost metagenome]
MLPRQDLAKLADSVDATRLTAIANEGHRPGLPANRYLVDEGLQVGGVATALLRRENQEGIGSGELGKRCSPLSGIERDAFEFGALRYDPRGPSGQRRADRFFIVSLVNQDQFDCAVHLILLTLFRLRWHVCC